MRLTQIVEALLFASDAPLSAADLARVDERLDEDTVMAVVEELRSEYDREERSFSVFEVAGGYQLLSRPEFDIVLERYQTVPQASKLSMPALEVLAIIAYRQPLGRAEVEEIRGVQSSAVIRTLQDRALIEPVARGEGLGRPLLYGTTPRFLEHFGFRSLEDLPKPDELPVILRAPEPKAEPEQAAPFAPHDRDEPSPLSVGAEAEAESLHLHVTPAREHPESAAPEIEGENIEGEVFGDEAPDETPDDEGDAGDAAERDWADDEIDAPFEDEAKDRFEEEADDVLENDDLENDDFESDDFESDDAGAALEPGWEGDMAVETVTAGLEDDTVESARPDDERPD
jgi:segregation and condensation protein B